MSGPNTTQNPNTTNYNLGRGKVYVSDLDANGLPFQWRDIGNTPEFKYTVTTTSVQHKQSMAALKTVDSETVTEMAMETSFIIDELSFENLALFTNGSKSFGTTNPAVAGFTNATILTVAQTTAAGALGVGLVGYWFDIETTAGIRAYDVLANKIVIAAVSPSTGGTLVSGTDYVLDLKLGRFQLTATGAAKSVLTAPGAVSIVLTADAGSSATFDQVQGLVATPIKRAVKLASINASNNGEVTEYEFHSVLLAPTGDAQMIADTYEQMGFKGAAQKNNNALYATSPYMTITKPTTPR